VVDGLVGLVGDGAGRQEDAQQRRGRRQHARTLGGPID
jgi:hypothetical protein